MHTTTHELLANAESYVASFDKGAPPLPPARIEASPFIPLKIVRGFVHDVHTGALREVRP